MDSDGLREYSGFEICVACAFEVIFDMRISKIENILNGMRKKTC